jgi:hypothetical protein
MIHNNYLTVKSLLLLVEQTVNITIGRSNSGTFVAFPSSRSGGGARRLFFVSVPFVCVWERIRTYQDLNS